MKELKPNKEQEKLINNLDGVYLADAGAGTGKTFCITERYINILKNSKDPEDIFLATFTRNAAEEMKERISNKTEVKQSKIFDAPISTFHSHCQRILERNGYEAPSLLGIDQNLTENINIMESQIREQQEFQKFIQEFKTNNGKFNDFFRIIDSEYNLLYLLKSIAAKGIIPKQSGWFGGTERYLDGNYQEFKGLFKEKNKKIEGNGGEKQSELRRRLYSYKWKNFEPEAPSIDDIRGGYGTKKVRKDFCRKAFEEDREKLKKFIHELYLDYLKYCLERNFLNFSFLMSLTYVLLYEKPDIRQKESFEYVMIDEFQDTNEIQFKLGLLLSEKPNICVVGDWKQSIYSFQHANVENILNFEERLTKYLKELEKSGKSFNQEVNVQNIELIKNYRSTQSILDLSETAFDLRANAYENPKKVDISSLKSQSDEKGEIRKLESQENSEEAKMILAKINELINNKDLAYSDIAVLTRTRSFGLDLQRQARDNNIPASYEGGVELFKTNPSIILLAWLRILQDKNSQKGWAVILENTGYRLPEARYIIRNHEYPQNMLAFREELLSTETIGARAEKVFQKYGYRSGLTEKIIEVLGDTFNSTYMNLGEIIAFIEENISENEIYEVENGKTSETITIQTIHAAKGLEYPAVFISDVNQSKFPSTNTPNTQIIYKDPIGLRQKKKYLRKDYSYSFDNWRTQILEKCLSGQYGEERRLMYVAMTRAERYLYITADSENKSPFFKEIGCEKEEIEDINISEGVSEKDKRSTFQIG